MWWYFGVAVGLALSAYLSRLVRSKPDKVSDKWIAEHYQSTGHQDGWIRRGSR